MTAPEFLIGLDFFGAGNIGDDLMLAGFLKGIKDLGLSEKMRRLRALCSQDRASQKNRFPEIEWVDGKAQQTRWETFKSADVLLGIGGTPFQFSTGPWLLENIEEVIARKKEQAPFIFVNAGSESEANRAKPRFESVMQKITSISARDKDTIAQLGEWRNGSGNPELLAGADLANISLPGLTENHPPLATRPDELAVILGSDTLSKTDVRTVIDWIAEGSRPVSWITCEVRNMARCEYRVYLKNWFRLGGSIVRKPPLIRLYRPRYQSCGLAALVEPFSFCKTILSSRYHGILSAAWSGCRVAGIARSSKVKWLCQQLEIPVVELPITREALSNAEKNAEVVKRPTLEKFRELAIQGIDGHQFDQH
jgi:hypothetical protein